MKKNKVYVAGPMRGYPRFNFDAFEEATRFLREVGFEVTSPHEMDLDRGFDPDKTIEEQGFDLYVAVRADVEAVMAADAVVLLPGADDSAGAMMEANLATMLGKEVFYLVDLLGFLTEMLSEEGDGEVEATV